MAKEEVLSPVTGKVWKIEKAVGDMATADDSIMIVESMKMEIEVQATNGGKLVEFRVAEDDAVDEGQILAIVET